MYSDHTNKLNFINYQCSTLSESGEHNSLNNGTLKQSNNVKEVKKTNKIRQITGSFKSMFTNNRKYSSQLNLSEVSHTDNTKSNTNTINSCQLLDHQLQDILNTRRVLIDCNNVRPGAGQQQVFLTEVSLAGSIVTELTRKLYIPPDQAKYVKLSEAVYEGGLISANSCQNLNQPSFNQNLYNNVVTRRILSHDYPVLYGMQVFLLKPGFRSNFELIYDRPFEITKKADNFPSAGNESKTSTPHGPFLLTLRGKNPSKDPILVVLNKMSVNYIGGVSCDYVLLHIEPHSGPLAMLNVLSNGHLSMKLLVHNTRVLINDSSSELLPGVEQVLQPGDILHIDRVYVLLYRNPTISEPHLPILDKLLNNGNELSRRTSSAFSIQPFDSSEEIFRDPTGWNLIHFLVGLHLDGNQQVLDVQFTSLMTVSCLDFAHQHCSSSVSAQLRARFFKLIDNHLENQINSTPGIDTLIIASVLCFEIEIIYEELSKLSDNLTYSNETSLDKIHFKESSKCYLNRAEIVHEKLFVSILETELFLRAKKIVDSEIEQHDTKISFVDCLEKLKTQFETINSFWKMEFFAYTAFKLLSFLVKSLILTILEDWTKISWGKFSGVKTKVDNIRRWLETQNLHSIVFVLAPLSGLVDLVATPEKTLRQMSWDALLIFNKEISPSVLFCILSNYEGAPNPLWRPTSTNQSELTLFSAKKSVEEQYLQTRKELNFSSLIENKNFSIFEILSSDAYLVSIQKLGSIFERKDKRLHDRLFWLKNEVNQLHNHQADSDNLKYGNSVTLKWKNSSGASSIDIRQRAPITKDVSVERLHHKIKPNPIAPISSLDSEHDSSESNYDESFLLVNNETDSFLFAVENESRLELFSENGRDSKHERSSQILEIVNVELERSPHGFGMTISDASAFDLERNAVFISNLRDGYPAARSKLILPGDEIVEVNNNLVSELDYQQVKEIIQKSKILVMKLLRNSDINKATMSKLVL